MTQRRAGRGAILGPLKGTRSSMRTMRALGCTSSAPFPPPKGPKWASSPVDPSIKSGVEVWVGCPREQVALEGVASLERQSALRTNGPPIILYPPKTAPQIKRMSLWVIYLPRGDRYRLSMDGCVGDGQLPNTSPTPPQTPESPFCCDLFSLLILLSVPGWPSSCLLSPVLRTTGPQVSPLGSSPQ